MKILVLGQNRGMKVYSRFQQEKSSRSTGNPSKTNLVDSVRVSNEFQKHWEGKEKLQGEDEREAETCEEFTGVDGSS